ncbi:tyrosine-protein phosphatase [Nocardia sp. NPDC048505]|uniref:tyrosine-protein phosphatase n=1 Tax=unclassified Nocardia TaxID=2637762 RepID=UPI0033D6902E
MTIHHRLVRLTAAAAVASVLAAGVQATATAQPAPANTGSSSGSADSGDNAAPRLASVDNFRDVGGLGSGYPAGSGERVRQGVFYRSNVFTTSDADLATLRSLRLAAVYDLRGPAEIAAKPDRLPDGVAYRNIPILSGNIEEEAGAVRSQEEARELARNVYRTFVTGSSERAAIGELLTALATTPGRQVFHCNAGKDRTGWVAATLLGLAGVARETIMADFLLTNEFSAKSIKARRDQIVAQYGEAAAQIFDPILGVEATFLEAAWARMDQDYGSVEKYVTTGLGLTPTTAAQLRSKLLS